MKINITRHWLRIYAPRVENLFHNDFVICVITQPIGKNFSSFVSELA